MVEPNTIEARGEEIEYFPIAGNRGPGDGTGKLCADGFSVYFSDVTVDTYPEPEHGADPFSVVYIWKETQSIGRSLITQINVDYGDGNDLAEALRK